MSSPYLDQVRHAREVVEQLIATRELELSRVTFAVQRQRVERDLMFLREELARLTDQE
jgi:hypothetical protein